MADAKNTNESFAEMVARKKQSIQGEAPKVSEAKPQSEATTTNKTDIINEVKTASGHIVEMPTTNQNNNTLAYGNKDLNKTSNNTRTEENNTNVVSGNNDTCKSNDSPLKKHINERSVKEIYESEAPPSPSEKKEDGTKAEATKNSKPQPSMKPGVQLDDLSSYVKKHWKRIAVVIGSLFLSIYLLGFFNNSMNGIVTIDPVANYKTVFAMDNGWLYAIIFTAVLYFIITTFITMTGPKDYDDDLDIDFANSNLYGSGGLMTHAEKKEILAISKNYEDIKGYILGKELKSDNIIALPYDTPFNFNVAVCGSQGSKKSWAYVRNLIMKLAENGSSILITDSKGELSRDTAHILQHEFGYTVKFLNLKDLIASDSWHCLADVNEETLQTLVEVIIRNTTDSYDTFYDGAEMDLLKALCLYVKQDPNLSEEEKTLAAAYNLLTENDLEKLERMFNILDDREPAKQAFRLFAKADKMKGNAILGLGTRLQILQNKKLAHITGYSDIDLELPAKEKCAYFVITSDQEGTYNVIATLFITLLIIKVTAYADKNGGVCKVPIHLLLEEMPNIGIIPEFEKKLGTLRGRRIGCSMVFQNFPQLTNRFKDNIHMELLGGCDTQVFLGCNDMDTAEYYSKMTGEATINVTTQRKTLNTIRVTNYTHDYAESEGRGKRFVRTPDEVKRMIAKDQAIIWVGGSKPLICRKFGFDENPYFKKMVRVEPHTHIPEWVLALKDETNFRTEYGGLYSLGKPEELPYYFHPVFEQWREEALNKIEVKDTTFIKKLQKASLVMLSRIKNLLSYINMRQSEDILNYIEKTIEYGHVDADTYKQMEDERQDRLDKELDSRKISLDMKKDSGETKKNVVSGNSNNATQKTDNTNKAINENGKESNHQKTKDATQTEAAPFSMEALLASTRATAVEASRKRNAANEARQQEFASNTRKPEVKAPVNEEAKPQVEEPTVEEAAIPAMTTKPEPATPSEKEEQSNGPVIKTLNLTLKKKVVLNEDEQTDEDTGSIEDLTKGLK